MKNFKLNFYYLVWKVVGIVMVVLSIKIVVEKIIRKYIFVFVFSFFVSKKNNNNNNIQTNNIKLVPPIKLMSAFFTTINKLPITDNIINVVIYAERMYNFF